MFKNYFIICFRNLLRYKFYNLLNILGLSIALAVSIIMLNHVKTELSYDKHFPKADRIFRIINKTIGERGEWNWAPTAPLMAEEIRAFVPEIEKTVRFRQMNNLVIEDRSDTNNVKKYDIENGFFVDSSIFDIFDVEFINGDKHSALSEPASIVLTESLAGRIFGSNDVIGKSLFLEGSGIIISVTAIIKDFQETSHFSLDFLIDWQSFIMMIKHVNLEYMYNSHGWAGVYTYALLRENISARSLKEKLFEFRKDFYSDFISPDEVTGEFILQPITDIHLRSNLEQEIEPNGNLTYVIVFGLGAIFILIIAGVNYVNISTARAFNRIKEIGVRKVLGARRIHLFNQFQGEALLTTFMAALISILLVDLILPVYNSMTGKTIDISGLFTLQNIILFFIIVIVLGSLAGLYPSFFVSRFSPVEAIKEVKNPVSSTNIVRKILIILQFTISVFMIFSTLVIYRQMKYFRTMDLGFDKSRVINIHLNGSLRRMAVNDPGALKDEMKKIPFVIGTSCTSQLLGENFSVEGFIPDNRPDNSDNPAIRFLRADEDFINLLGIKLIDGSNFSLPAGKESQYILNQRAVEILGLEHPLGIVGTTYLGQKGEVVGVVEDFHFASLHHLIEPLILEQCLDPEFRDLWLSNILIKLTPGNVADMIRDLEKYIEKMAPGTTFNYVFLDDHFDRLYKSEANLGDIFKAFALFTILISCLGLFGLSSYTVELKTKEIGIRKSLGARTQSIFILISRQFLVYVFISLVIALPAGFLYMHNWLQNFAYRIDIQFPEFLVTAFLALFITLFSVSYQALKAGFRNPVNALRYE